MSKAIEKQIARIEAKVNARTSGDELANAKIGHEIYSEHLRRVMEAIEPGWRAKVWEQMEAAAAMPEQGRLWSVAHAHEQCDLSGTVGPLLAGALHLARRLVTQIGCSITMPCAMPPAICELLEARGHEIYRHPTYSPPIGDARAKIVPHLVWLSGNFGHVACVACHYCVPHVAPFSRGGAAVVASNHTRDELPLVACPVCGGGLSHSWS